MSAEMTRRNFVGAAAASAAIALAACAGGETAPEPAPEGEPEATVENPADLVLKNAAVYTVDDNWTVASAVAVKGDTIMAVGSDDDMAAYIGPDTEVKDLGGMMLMPGFMNGHDHIVYEPDTTCDLAATEANLDAYMAAIHEYVDAHPGQPYYEVSNLDLRAWPNSAANNERLNEEFPDTPILGVDVSVHGRIVNQALMDLAGIDENTPVPDGGVVYYYEDGTLNGYLSDAGSMLDSLPELPEPTEEECIAAFSEFQAMANSLGITGFHDGGNFESTVQMLHDFGETGNMTLRISLPIWAFEVRPQLAADTIAALDSVQELNSDFVRANSAKSKIDGVPEGRSAYMLEPYAPTAGVDADFRSAPNWRDQESTRRATRSSSTPWATAARTWTPLPSSTPTTPSARPGRPSATPSSTPPSWPPRTSRPAARWASSTPRRPCGSTSTRSSVPSSSRCSVPSASAASTTCAPASTPACS